jgi:hypothetical protein
MSSVHALFHLVRASFLERVRRRNFLVVLLFVTLLSLAIATGRLVLRLDVYVGEYNSAWVGALVAGSTTVLLCFANFFIVKNALEIDRRTGVGELVAATPTGKFIYLLGKLLSNFVVLLAMECILIASAILIQLVHGETNIEWLALLLPFVFIALPAMAAISALALLFETLPGLRSGFGNLVFVFMWFGMTFMVMQFNDLRFDLPGLIYVDAVFTEAAQVMDLPFSGGFSVEGGSLADPFAHVVRWDHVTWLNEIVWWRLYWFVIAIGLTLLAALMFDRFDPVRRLPHMFRWPRRKAAGVSVDRLEWERQNNTLEEHHKTSSIGLVTTTQQLTPVDKLSGMRYFLRVFWLELRLILKQPWWWYLVTLGLVVTSLVAPVQNARTMWVPLIWLWLALTLSGLGLRESRHNTEQLVFNIPLPSVFQVLATWLSGFILMIVTGIGGARLILMGEGGAALAWGIAAVFIPSFAIAAGILSGNRRLFEGLFIAWWFIGPMASKGTGLDFMGVHQEVVARGVHWFYLIAAILLLLIALIGRWLHQRSL